MLKNFIPIFNSIKDKVQEFGYFGCDELYLQFPLSNLNPVVLCCATKDNKEILGVKSKYNVFLQENNGEIKLRNLENYDVLEDIKVFDEDDNEVYFDIIICDNINGTCEISKEKTIFLNSVAFQYKISLKNKDIKEVYVKADGYMFNCETRNMLFKYIF